MVESEILEEKPAKEGSKSKSENSDTSKSDHGEQATEEKGEAKEKRKRGRKKKEEEVEGSEEKEVKEDGKKEKGKGKKAQKESEVVERKGERTSSRERKAVERFSVPGSPRSGSAKKGISIVQVCCPFHFLVAFSHLLCLLPVISFRFNRNGEIVDLESLHCMSMWNFILWKTQFRFGS